MLAPVVTLDAEQLTIVLAGLADAASHRTAEAMSPCLACAREQRAPGGDAFCEGHRADLGTADVYRDLAALLTGGAR